LSGRGLCDELITRPEESYRLCCVVVCDLETSRMGAPYTYDVSHLRVNVGPYIFLSTLLSKTSRQFCSVTVIAHGGICLTAVEKARKYLSQGSHI